MTAVISTVQSNTMLELQPYLTWLHELLRWHVAVTRTTYAALADDPYRGLYLPDAEVELLSEAWPSLPKALQQEHKHLLASIAEHWNTTECSLHTLAQRCSLTMTEALIVLLALAPELDERYERLYGYIQDDVNKKRPFIALAGRLLSPTPEAALELRSLFTANAPLVKHKLIQFPHEPHQHGSNRQYSIDSHMVQTLLGATSLDPRLAQWVAHSKPERTFSSIIMEQPWLQSLQTTVATYPGLKLGLQGSYGSGRRALVHALAAQNGHSVLEFNFQAAMQSDAKPAEILTLIRRDCLLRDAVLLIHGFIQPEHGEQPNEWRSQLNQWLNSIPGIVVITLEKPWHAQGVASYIQLTVPELSYSEREQLWRHYTNGWELDEITYRHVSSTFRLNGGQIRDAAQLSQRLATFNQRTRPTAKDIFSACRAQSGEQLAALARKIEPTYSWHDLVLPTEIIVQLQEMCMQVRQRQTVLEEWGFEAHLAMGKGINALFAGSSGTGKTMAAEVIAGDLGLDLYKVNLSTMVSKYIGETEKNLEQIFDAARQANAILFFDEADSIFGKRSEVRDANDRYANMEVGYLLQKMEEYDGIVILATNLSKNMDEAFVRRLHVAAEFPFPEEADRLTIWRKVFPKNAPINEDLDWEFMAQQFRLSGGNIRNIALLAAFLAAEDQSDIRMVHAIRATRREYQKLGRLVTESTFGPYISLVRQEGTTYGRF